MKNLFNTVFLIGFISILIHPVCAQTVFELTEDESVRRGLEHSFRLHAARANAAEAQAAFRQTRAGRLPVIQSQASYMRLSDNIPEVDFTIPGIDQTFTVLPVELDQFHSEVSIEQPLFTGGRIKRQIQAASHQLEAAGFMRKQEEADVAFEIRQAYWNLYRAMVAHETLETALVQVEEHLRDVRTRVEEGTALRTDLLNAETRRSEVLLERVETRSRVRVARLELNRLIGLPPDAQTEPVEPGEPEMELYEITGLIQQALDERPGLHVLSEQVRAHEAEVRATQSTWFPNISLIGRYIYARPNPYFFAEPDRFRGTWEAGVALRWNIWSGGQRVHETDRFRARQQNAEARLEDMREQIVVMVSRYYLELERATEAVEVAAENIEAAGEAFRTARMQFDEGVALSTHVLDAEFAYRTAQARHADAIADYKIAQASVLNALGHIW